MPDYRNRGPVDRPRLTPLGVLRSVPVTVLLIQVALWLGIGAVGYAIAVAAGLAWR